MGTGKVYTYSHGKSWFERIIGSLIFLVIIFLFFYLSFQIYKVMFLLSPVFIIIALAIQPKIVWDYIKGIASVFNKSILGGFLQLIVQILGLPLVSIGLIFKAWFYKKFTKLNEQLNKTSYNEEFITYEEVENKRTEFSKKVQEKNKKENTYYDELFE